MKTIFTICSLVFASQIVHAANTSLICQNPRQEYSVKFDDVKRKLVLNKSTSYKVLAIEKQDDATIAVGSTVNGGPTFKLVLSKDNQPKFEFYEDDKLFQTDKCRYVK